MLRVVIYELRAHKLRNLLTAMAIFLGVSMITGTYIETDQISSALTKIVQTTNTGIDVVIAKQTTFGTRFGQRPPLPAGLIARVRAVDGVSSAAGEIQAIGSLVVRGKYLGKATRAPTFIFSSLPPPLTAYKVVSGSEPVRHGEIAVSINFAQLHSLHIGQRVGLATDVGVVPVVISGVITFTSNASLGAASIITTTFSDAQNWFSRRGQTSLIVAAAKPGITPTELVARLRKALPADLQIETGLQSANQQAQQISNAISSFLLPALLALAGAALLVGAFIIFNTFSITVTQRVRTFALLRTLGATPQQILISVVAEALVIGILGSVGGLAGGLGFAQLLDLLFDTIGFQLPESTIIIKDRTIVVALVTGIVVTVVAVLIPALRATRVPEAAAVSEGARIPPTRFTRFAVPITVLVLLVGLAAIVQGLYSGASSTDRLAELGVGALLIFIGLAICARWFVRPLVGVIGWPLARMVPLSGRLARDNARRNPARTSITAASLMIGLALVVFVAVFTSGLKASVTNSVTHLLKADLIVSSQVGGPEQGIPAQSAQAIQTVAGVNVVEPIRYDQIRVGSSLHRNATTDYLEAVDPQTISSVYDTQWLNGGSNKLFSKLGTGTALVEEQFADAHHVVVGQTIKVTTPTGRSVKLKVIGEYKDPQFLQGVMVANATFNSISAVKNPYIILVSERRGTNPDVVEAAVSRALSNFPQDQVQSNIQYRQSLDKRLDQLLYFLDALLAMSVLISIFGITNSLALSIHERTREIGVLQALGATPRQIRRMIRYESVITALIGGLMGIGIGLLFAYLITESLSDLGLVLSIPVWQLLLCLIVAVAVGVLAAIGPARRGSRIDMLDALRYE